MAGALGRIAAGQLSDVVASRMRPLRWVTVAAAATMLLLGATAGLDLPVAVPLVVVATAVTVADNGLAFTAVAERAGPFWSGRALGVQNTAQFLAAAAVPPLAGLTVTWLGYPATFALAAVFPLAALAMVPVQGRARALLTALPAAAADAVAELDQPEPDQRRSRARRSRRTAGTRSARRPGSRSR